MEAEYTGGSVSYNAIKVERPTNPGADPYTAECNDIIEALGMNYAEGNAFKAIWRRCAARLGKSKKGYTDGLYDAEKVVFFGLRLVAQETAGYAVNDADLIGVAAQPDADCWIDWHGGECPVDLDTVVDCIYTDGFKAFGTRARNFSWPLIGSRSDIAKYRIHKEQ